MIDILIVLASADRRGAEIEGSAVASALRDRGLETQIVALSPARHGRELDVEVLGADALSLRTLKRLRRRMRHAKAVIAFGSTTLPACAIAGVGLRVPLVYRSIGSPGDWTRGGWHRRRTALLFRRVRKVAVLWDGAAEEFIRLYNVPPDDVVLIPNSRDPGVFNPASAEQKSEARAALALPTDGLVVAFIGALVAEKRPDLAVDCMSHLPDACLIVIGDGPLRSAIAAQAQEIAPNRVKVLGGLDDVTIVYQAADVVLLTSATEGMPGVLIEAGLCGLPAASAIVGAVTEMAATGTCIATFPPNASPEQVASAVLSASTRRDGARAARARIASIYGSGSVTSQWGALLNSLR